MEPNYCRYRSEPAKMPEMEGINLKFSIFNGNLCSVPVLIFFVVAQENMKLNEEQLATLSSPKAVNEYLKNQEDNITQVIKQNLAVGDIFKRENLQVLTSIS